MKPQLQSLQKKKKKFTDENIRTFKNKLFCRRFNFKGQLENPDLLKFVLSIFRFK